MAKSNPRRRPTVRVTSKEHSLSDTDGWHLDDWINVYTEFATTEGVLVESVKIDVTVYNDECEFTLYSFREQTREEELAAKKDEIERKNNERERVRRQIEMLAERYPDLMPYQVQELP